MTGQIVRTGTPGIYKRGQSYLVKQRDRTGRMHTKSAPTMGAAKREQSKLRADAARGELRMETRDRFDTYALAWIESYPGRTSRGLRASTREEYRRALVKHAIPFFRRMRITDITPPDIRDYMRHCASLGLGKHGVKNAVGPVKAMLATAFDDGDIRVNPAANVRVILPTQLADDGVRALAPDELERLIAETPPQWRLLVRFLACTGLRVGEVAELRWHDVDFERGQVNVRRGVYRGVIGPPKSRFAVRSIPLIDSLHEDLEARRDAADYAADSDLVFANQFGSHLDVHNVRQRVMRPAAARAGVPWASFHSLRHTFASICFRQGCTAKQVQMLLGHHAASFTLDIYIHSVPADLPELGFLSSIGEGGAGSTGT